MNPMILKSAVRSFTIEVLKALRHHNCYSLLYFNRDISLLKYDQMLFSLKKLDLTVDSCCFCYNEKNQS